MVEKGGGLHSMVFGAKASRECVLLFLWIGRGGVGQVTTLTSGDWEWHSHAAPKGIGVFKVWDGRDGLNICTRLILGVDEWGFEQWNE